MNTRSAYSVRCAVPSQPPSPLLKGATIQARLYQRDLRILVTDSWQAAMYQTDNQDNIKLVKRGANIIMKGDGGTGWTYVKATYTAFGEATFTDEVSIIGML